METSLKLSRWWRVAFILGIILFVPCAIAYWLSRSAPPRLPLFVPIHVKAKSISLGAQPAPTGSAAKVKLNLQGIQKALDDLAHCPAGQPVVVDVSAAAVRGQAGSVFILPADASLDDAATWLPLRVVLEKLKACPAPHKLLVLELTPPPALARTGHIYHDFAAALPAELAAVPDARRLVLSACAAGQQPPFSAELGQSVFAHYVRAGLRGSADGYGARRDGRVTVKELSAFVTARVARWAEHNRAAAQTPMLLGTGSDFTLASFDGAAPREITPLVAEHKYSGVLRQAWEGRDRDFRTGRFRLTPRHFQWRQADLLRKEKARYDDVRAQTEATLVRSPRGARHSELFQFAAEAPSASGPAWPGVVSAALLRATEQGEKAYRQTPYMPNYVALLEEPALLRHAGEVRLWARGYASLDEAQKNLTTAAEQFEQLMRVNEHWRRAELAVDEAFAELPWYLEALDHLPELRAPWLGATAAAAAMAETVNQRYTGDGWRFLVLMDDSQALEASTGVREFQQCAAPLRAPFTQAAIAALERQCRAPGADARTRQRAEAILRVGSPILQAPQRVLLWRAAQALSRRLNSDTMALDAQDDQTQRCTPLVAPPAPAENECRHAAMRARWQLALLELAGMPEERLRPLRQRMAACEKRPTDPVGWCELGPVIRTLTHRQLAEQFKQARSWRQRERLAWVMPPLAYIKEVDAVKASPTLERRRRDQAELDNWRREHQRYLARDYQGIGLESPGIMAARHFYANAIGRAPVEPLVRMSVAAPVEPLTPKHPEAYFTLEVTRTVPPGAFGPVELRIHGADDGWLDVAPQSATLPALVAAKEPRTLTHKVALAALRRPKAERSGLPVPLGFLVEARFEGRSYHHVVTVPIVPSAQEVQILVGAAVDEPGATGNPIRVRPGQVKQPYHVYVKNLSNRLQRVHVEIKAGASFLHKSQKPLTIEPDGVGKVHFEEGKRVGDLRGPVQIRVLDGQRGKVLDEKSLRVEILLPRDYVKTADARYEAGAGGRNKWAVQVETAKHVQGPAIAAQLVLPAQRIPGFLGIGGGTLHVELPTQTDAPRVLFAENLRLTRVARAEGPVYLDIDGVPRAFVYRTTFGRGGAATWTRRDDAPAVRIVVPPCVAARRNFLVDVEVDNAPQGCRLEVALGRTLKDGSFKAELVREFADAKKRRLEVETSKDALVFTAAIGDQAATFDTRAIAGARELRARVIDAVGREIAVTRQAVVIDGSAPSARIVAAPAQIKKGGILQIQARGADAESGIAQVVFFIGRPELGEIPPQAPRIKAIPATRDRTIWRAALLMPANTVGPLAVSVRVVNNAGLASTDTITIDVTDGEPGKTGKGDIRGQVNEGPRPQRNLFVTLLDQTGMEIARTRTDADGNYAFEQLPPGRYRVICLKPESQRRAVLDVEVEPDRAVRADLALAL